MCYTRLAENTGRKNHQTRAQLSQRKPTVALLPDAQTPLSQNTHSHIRNSQITNCPGVI